MALEDIDALDVVTGLTGACLVAVSPTLLAALPVAGGWWILHAIRRSKGVQEWGDRISQKHPALDMVMPLLLPAPKDDDGMEVTLKQNAPLDVNIVNPKPDRLPWAQRITQPMEYPKELGTATTKTTKANKVNSTDTMNAVLKIMPRYIGYERTPEAPTPTSVLIGYDPVGKRWVWADFGHEGDTLHALIAGQTGAGKDSELRLWYTQLTSNNSPEDVQFVVLDGKGEWLTPSLMESPHMLVKPAGGVEVVRDEKGKWVDLANEKIEASIGAVFELIADRNAKFQKVGATNLQSYTRKTGEKLPLIFIIATDVGTNIEQQLEMLVKMLTFKGRSFGIRLIVSMQTASGQDTGWRGQLALAMSGFQQQPSADAPNLGVPIKNMKYRPSDLPSPDDKVNRGLFVVRKGDQQLLVKTIHLPDDVFEEYCEAQVNNRQDQSEVDDFLASLIDPDRFSGYGKELQEKREQVVIPPPQKVILTQDQVNAVIKATMQGKTKTEIMVNILKFTNNARYKEANPVVETLMKATKQRMAKGK